MEESVAKVIELAVGQGIWAVLYIYLFFRMLKENEEREERYQTIIGQLTGNIESGIEKIQSTGIYRFFMYIAYRSNISLYEFSTYTNVQDEYGKRGGFWARSKRNERESHEKARDRIIKYEHIKSIISGLLTLMQQKAVRLDYLCKSIEDRRHYPISRIIMILSNFEGEFKRIYGQDYKRSDSYKNIKKEVIDILENLVENKTGREKAHIKDLVKYIKNRDSSYKNRVMHAINDSESIIKPMIIKLYDGEYGNIIDGISDRMNTMRNYIAHCHLDITVEAIHLTDLHVIEVMIYVMRLKKLGLDDEYIREATTSLFGK